MGGGGAGGAMVHAPKMLQFEKKNLIHYFEN